MGRGRCQARQAGRRTKSLRLDIMSLGFADRLREASVVVDEAALASTSEAVAKLASAAPPSLDDQLYRVRTAFGGQGDPPNALRFNEQMAEAGLEVGPRDRQ